MPANEKGRRRVPTNLHGRTSWRRPMGPDHRQPTLCLPRTPVTRSSGPCVW
ncbi:hypothetical protein MRX96_052912, partial [Rhipicephalus microplus]